MADAQNLCFYQNEVVQSKSSDQRKIFGQGNLCSILSKLVNNRSICDQLVVLHESEHYLAVNKHHDLIFNTDPPDTR